MQHLKLLFTCGGLFDINLKYFGGVQDNTQNIYNALLKFIYLQMLVTILGYIIILIQFKIQAIAENKYKASFNISG